MLKRDVRELARKLGLPNHAKRDSTGICFIGERPVPRVPDALSAHRAGPDAHARRTRWWVTHQGLMYYTIGQRQGLGIGGQGEAWYVADKDMASNCLVVVQGHDHPALFSEAWRPPS